MTYEAVWRPPCSQMAILLDGRGNMHIDTRVIKVAGFKSEVKLDCQECLGHQNLNLNFPWPLSTEVYRAIALLFMRTFIQNTCGII